MFPCTGNWETECLFQRIVEGDFWGIHAFKLFWHFRRFIHSNYVYPFRLIPAYLCWKEVPPIYTGAPKRQPAYSNYVIHRLSILEMKDRKIFKKGLILIEDLTVIENEKKCGMYKVPSRVSFQISCILESFFDQCNVTTTTTPALSASSRDLSTTSRSYPAAKTNSSGGLNGSKCFEQASSTGNRWRFFSISRRFFDRNSILF